MVDSPVTISTIIGESSKGKIVQECSAYLQSTGLVTFFQMGDLSKNTPSLRQRDIIAKQFRIEPQMYEKFNLDDHSINQDISFLLGINVVLDT